MTRFLLISATLWILGCATPTFSVYPRPADAIVSYDLYVLPTFSRPSRFAVEKHENDYLLREYFYTGMGGYSFRKLDYVRIKRLTYEQWEELLRLLEDDSFWNPSSSDALVPAVLDGTTFRLTRKRGDRTESVYPEDKFEPKLNLLVNRLQTL